MKRLFFALWPDPETRAKCAAIASALKPAGRLVHPDNLHVTLVFLGGVDDVAETKLVEAAAAIPFSPITIQFATLSHWRRPRIICLTGQPEDAAAANLVGQLNALAASLNLPIDDRPYQAHVTLLRKANRLPPLTFEPIVWQSDTFSLVESCSLPEGAVYRVLHTWRLPEARHEAGGESEAHPGLTNPGGAIIIDATFSADHS